MTLRIFPNDGAASSIGRETLPPALAQDLHSLLSSVARCCRAPSEWRDLVVVIRQRPVDAAGVAGCHLEIHAHGPPPSGGIRDLRWAAGLGTRLGRPHREPPRYAPPAGVTTQSLSLEKGVLSGWKVTYDVRWKPETSGQKEGWSI